MTAKSQKGTRSPAWAELEENWDEVRPLIEEMLEAARVGLGRSKWSIGDPDEKLLMPIIGALTVHFSRELDLQNVQEDEPPTEAMLREQIAQELRDVALRHPLGSIRRKAFNEAAAVAEQGPRGDQVM
ncbi:hypothetical protein [Streptomyces sp. NPDC056069]|uniref:hypothetical protein n=1 Tax=Streptomyces sp. NPDC056069 TaxID=3345702 RepID=UPI0035D981E2